ncbi:MAG: radical SAM protein [Novosphingobium sp.]|nr:radical SAM protein [Novosphingobium sp.]
MKICLIYLPHPYLVDPEAQAPLGLLYIASSLEQTKQHDVILKNYSSYTEEEAINDLPECDVYGITVTALELLQSNDFAKKIKNKYPNSKVILGGPGTFSDQYVDWIVIDSILKGEGEITIHTILDDILLGNEQKIYKGEVVKNLDIIPFPARHLLKDKQGGHIFANHTTFDKTFSMEYKGKGTTSILTSRGCGWGCSFCSSPGMNQKLRFRSPQNVYNEIKHIVDTYKIKQFRFSDEMFTANKKHVLEICELIKPLGIVWRISARVKPLSMEILKAMKKAGCVEISFGVESFDDDVLKGLNKGTTAEDNAKALQMAKDAGLMVRVLFMIRTPWQTIDTVYKNIDWLKKVPYDTIACTSFVPLPGCFDTKTEILTKLGWKKYNEIGYNDYFLTRNINNEIEYQKPLKITKEKYSGEMIKQKSKCIDYFVTPNHKFLINTYYKNDFQFRYAKDIKINNRIPNIGKWIGITPEPIIYIGKHTFNMKDWVAFLGIFISEGCTFKCKNYIYRVQITQSKKDNVRKIKNLLNDMGLIYSYNNDKDFVINSKDLYLKLKPLGKSWEKYIPNDIKQLNSDYLKILYKWLIMGDGHSRTKYYDQTYYSTSIRLVNDILEILLKIGKCGNYSVREPKECYIRGRKISSKRLLYTIQERKSKFTKLHTQNHKPQKVHYDNTVWCVSVPNKVIYVRRNGKCYFSGNSDIWKKPDDYNIEILNRNIQDYNFYFYGRDGKNDLKDIIKIKDRSLEELNAESTYFRNWIEQQGKTNKG